MCWPLSYGLHYLLAASSNRAVGRSEYPGVPVLFGGHNLSPLVELVEIGLTDLPKFGGAMAPPSHPGTIPLLQSTYFIHFYINEAKMNRDPNESWSDSIHEHLLSSPHVCIVIIQADIKL